MMVPCIRAQLVVELRQMMPAAALSDQNQLPMTGNRVAGVSQLKPHQHHQAEAEEEKQEARDRV